MKLEDVLRDRRHRRSRGLRGCRRRHGGCRLRGCPGHCGSVGGGELILTNAGAIAAGSAAVAAGSALASAAISESSSPRGLQNSPATAQPASAAGQNPQARSGASLIGQAADAVLTPMYNTFTRPGWNYGEYLADLDAGRGIVNPHLYGALVDSLLVIETIYTAFEQAVVYGSQRNPFWRYMGPQSDPAGTWVTRRARPPYGTDYELAMERLAAPKQWTEVKRVTVPWDQYVAGLRPAAPRFGFRGGGVEYRVGGFGNWLEYFTRWGTYWMKWMFSPE